MDYVAALLARSQDLKGRRLLVTAGPTVEDIDPVRFLSNRSSGKMGFAIARAARSRGAEVTLISGPTELEFPGVVRVRSTEEMRAAVVDRFDQVDALIKAAAPLDFRPKTVASQKIKKSKATTSMGMDLFNPPSVFSYFSPATGVPGSALKGPEFGVFNTSTAIKRANFVNTMVFSRVAVSANAPTGTSLDLAPWSSLADNPDLMVYWMSSIMMSGRVTPSMTDAIVTAVKAVPSNNPLQRVKTAVYLIATSAQYQVSR